MTSTSASAGRVLAGVTRTVSLLRPARKPLHPRGRLEEARIRRHGSDTRTGVGWLDDPGEDEAVVRLSRAIGLPAVLPDIHGLALRLRVDDAPGDLLFASTGRGRAGRFLLTAGRRPEDRPMTTLLPYRTSLGPVLLGAFPVAPGTYELCWARGAGAWHDFGVLELAGLARSREISFDPVRKSDRRAGAVPGRDPAPRAGVPHRTTFTSLNHRRVKPPARPQEETMTTDAIVLLKDDHKEILRVFRDFEQAGDDALQTKGRLVDRMIELLTVHTYIENEVMYPRVRELLPDLEDDVLESYEEHHVADVLVMELSVMDPSDERFTAKTTVLIENVRHHIEEEEYEWFPQVREGLGRTVLREIGADMIEARRRRRAGPPSPVP